MHRQAIAGIEELTRLKGGDAYSHPVLQFGGMGYMVDKLRPAASFTCLILIEKFPDPDIKTYLNVHQK